MSTVRWRLRWLIIGLMLTGVLWIHLCNFVKLGLTPIEAMQEDPTGLAITWGGAVVMGLALDILAGRKLRPFFTTLARLHSGQAVPREEADRATRLATRFPDQAALMTIAFGIGLTALFHANQVRGAWPLTALDRESILSNAAEEVAIVLILAVLIYSFGRRLLHQSVASLGLREVSSGRRVPIGARLLMLMMAQAAIYTASSLNASLPPVTPPERMIWLFLPLAALTGLVGYLAAADIGRDLTTISGRLRDLAGGMRPDLYHHLPVTGRDEVGELITAINRLQDRVEAEFRTIDRDMQAARSIQMGMLPHDWRLPPGWDLAARLIPAQEVAGDFYDVIPLGDHLIGIAVGDAAGKGLPAALLMASTVSLLRSHTSPHSTPGEVLSAVNRRLAGILPPSSFVTMLYAVVDLRHSSVTYASAGHLPPVVGGKEAEPAPALPLGVDPEARYVDRTVPLRPEESLVLLSDGVVEARDEAGRLLGIDQVEAALGQTGMGAGALIDRLMCRVREHGAGTGVQDDDITALVLIPPAELRLAVPCRPGEELIVAEAAIRFAREHGMASHAEEVGTAVGEAVLNGITHGNRLTPERPVTVLLRAGVGQLEAQVGDAGDLFVPPEAPPHLCQQVLGDGPIGGWGFHLMRSLAGEVRIEPLTSGKQVCLRFWARGGEAS